MAATSVKAGGPALELDDIQGLVARGYGNLRAACFVLAHIDDPRGATSWLRSITDEVTPASDRPQEHGTHVAFTSGGLSRLGLRADSARGFSAEFVGGMTTPHRRRLLGDVDGSAPERWAWGGPTTPPIDVALLLYAYARGERSSRRIERRCVEDVATRVICANQAPDHTTIARFRQRHETALAGLF